MIPDWPEGLTSYTQKEWARRWQSVQEMRRHIPPLPDQVVERQPWGIIIWDRTDDGLVEPSICVAADRRDLARLHQNSRLLLQWRAVLMILGSWVAMMGWVFGLSGMQVLNCWAGCLITGWVIGTLIGDRGAQDRAHRATPDQLAQLTETWRRVRDAQILTRRTTAQPLQDLFLATVLDTYQRATPTTAELTTDELTTALDDVRTISILITQLHHLEVLDDETLLEIAQLLHDIQPGTESTTLAVEALLELHDAAHELRTCQQDRLAALSHTPDTDTEQELSSFHHLQLTQANAAALQDRARDYLTSAQTHREGTHQLQHLTHPETIDHPLDA